MSDIKIDQLKESVEEILKKLTNLTFDINNEKLEDLQQDVFIFKNTINTFVKTQFKTEDLGDM